MKNISTFILLLIISQVGISQKYENLVFEGAGIRGIAYCGVIKELENQNITSDIKRVGGTSAGAITALMFSIGYESDEMYKIISETEFQNFNDGQYMFFGGFSRLNSNFGWYKGDEFIKWLDKIIKDKTGNSEITFRELKDNGFKELYVTATCLNKQKLVVFSSETYPNMKIKDAVRISMSIPLYFEAVFIDSNGTVYEEKNDQENLDIVVDGGILGNFPIFIFDSLRTDSTDQSVKIPNYKTLGIRIDSDSQIKNDLTSKELVPIPIDNMDDYLVAFYILILENLNRNALTSEDWERTISVSSVGIGPRIKSLTLKQKESLIKSGEDCARTYFKE